MVRHLILFVALALVLTTSVVFGAAQCTGDFDTWSPTAQACVHCPTDPNDQTCPAMMCPAGIGVCNADGQTWCVPAEECEAAGPVCGNKIWEEALGEVCDGSAQDSGCDPDYKCAADCSKCVAVSEGECIEYVEINSDTNPLLADYLQPGDGFGWSLVPLGQLPGGYKTIAVGAPYTDYEINQTFIADAGAVYILTYDQDNVLVAVNVIDYDYLSANNVILADSDRLGYSLDAGDIDGNGVRDIVVGIPGMDGASCNVNDSGIDSGAVGIIHLDANGLAGFTLLDESALSPNDPCLLFEYDNLGTDVNVVDVDQNNALDILVGAANADSGKGGFFIVFYGTQGNIDQVNKYTASYFVQYGVSLANGDKFGEAVAYYFDENNAFHAVIGAPGVDAVGALYDIEFTAADGMAIQSVTAFDYDYFKDNLNVMLHNGDLFAADIGVTDFDQNNVPEGAIGSPGYANTGAVYLFNPAQNNVFRIENNVVPVGSGDDFGRGVFIADANADGIQDLFVGAPGINNDEGGFWVIYSGAYSGNSDNDTVPDPFDNCDYTYNPNQRDKDGNCIGDVCEKEYLCGNGVWDKPYGEVCDGTALKNTGCDPKYTCTLDCSECVMYPQGTCDLLEVNVVNHYQPCGKNGSKQEPLGGIEVCVYDKAEGSCVDKLYGVSHQYYYDIYKNCPAVACGVTNAMGQVLIPLPEGDYLVISIDATKTVLTDPLGVSASDFTCDFDKEFEVTMKKNLQQIIKCDKSNVAAPTPEGWMNFLLVMVVAVGLVAMATFFNSRRKSG